MPDPAQILFRLLWNSLGGRKQRLSILIYHRVLSERDSMRPGEPTSVEFDWQMRLINHHFNVLPLDEATRLLREGRLPPRSVCVTFDDGYRDNLTVALPILQRYAIPATVFIASSYLDGGRMWNDTIIESLRLCPRETLELPELGMDSVRLGDINQRRAVAYDVIGKSKYLAQERREEIAAVIAGQVQGLPEDLMLTSEEVRELHHKGIQIGGHTVTHPILSRVDNTVAFEEILVGKNTLENICGAPVTTFAYPNGRLTADYTQDHAKFAEEAGFESAVTTEWGAADRATDPFQLPRFTPWDQRASKYLLRMGMNLRQ